MEGLWKTILLVLSYAPFFSLSGVKSWIFRRAGAYVGAHVHFAPHSRIVLPDLRRLKIGDGSSFGPHVYIHCAALEVGEDVQFGEGVFAGGPATLKVGNGSYLFRNVYIDLNEPVIIEDDVGVGADYILTHSVWHPVTEGGPHKFAGVHIKRGAYISMGVFIIPGVTIGEYATVGARAVVVEDVPDGVLVVGVPAKIVKTAEEARRRPSFEERTEIVKGILDAYTSRMRKTDEIEASEMFSDDLLLKSYLTENVRRRLFRIRKDRTAIIYSTTTATQNHIDSLENLCRKFDVILLVSLVPIPEEFMKTFEESRFSNLFWFSVEGKMRKKSWKPEVASLHNFFRSRYGIRFRFYRAKNEKN